MNYAKKGYCDANHINGTVSTKLNSNAWRKREWYNNKAACETAGFVWYEISTSDILDLGADNQFVCAKTQFSRVNQLGNARADSVFSQSLNAQTSGTILKSKVNEGLNAVCFIIHFSFLFSIYFIFYILYFVSIFYFLNIINDINIKSNIFLFRTASCGKSQLSPKPKINRRMPIYKTLINHV